MLGQHSDGPDRGVAVEEETKAGAANLDISTSDLKVGLAVFQVNNLDLSSCDSCRHIAVWVKGKLNYPEGGVTATASVDMPSNVRDVFDEAAAVFMSSSRASAALLRLALQLLLKELGEKGKNINEDIDSLTKKGLPHELLKVMHTVRIIGNESVHPGEISVNDEPWMAEAMFKLLCEIVDQMITRPKEQNDLWNSIPESKRTHVEKQLQKKE